MTPLSKLILSTKTSIKVIRENKRLHLLLIAGIFFFVLFLVDIKNRSRSQSPPVNDKIVSQTKECDNLTYNSQKEFDFVDQITITDQPSIDKIHFLFADVDYFKEKFSISENILNLDYSESLGKVVYLTGEDFSENKDHLREIIVFDLKNKEKTVLFSYQTRLLENQNESKFVPDANVLRNFSLSPDKTKIIILTDSNISVYSLISNKLEFMLLVDQFNLPTKEENSSVTINKKFYFSNAEFSPNMRYVVLTRAYWEGASYFLLDLPNKKIISLNKFGYGEGSHVYGWLNNDEIIFTDTEKDEGDYHALCAETLEGKNTRCLQLTDSPWAVKTFDNDKIFTLGKRKDNQQKHQGCNNINRPFEFYSTFDFLSRLSFVAKSESELLHVDSTEVSGFKIKTQILDLSPYVFEDKNLILVKLHDQTGQETFAFLDESQPEKLTKINLTNLSSANSSTILKTESIPFYQDQISQ